MTPEDAERLASTFRPIWELDDAPFAPVTQATALSAADVDALGAGAGVAPSVRTTEAIQAQAAPQVVAPLVASSPPTAITATTEIKSFPPGHVPAPDDPKVEIAIEVEPDPTPPPQVAIAQAQAAPTSVRKPYTPPRAPPPTVRMHREAVGSGEFAPVKKSNMGLIAGAIGVVVVLGLIFGVRAAMSGDKTDKTQSSTTATATHEEVHIPPPPPPDTTVATQATQTAQTQQVVQQPPPTQTAAPVATHQTTAALVAPVHTTAPAATHPATVHTGAAHTGGHSTIVRDNPF